MILTVAQYREMAGQPSEPPTDQEITLALLRYTALIEGFTGRAFSLASQVETHYKVGGGPLQLNLFPVAAITGLRVDAQDKDPAAFTVHKAAGLIYHDGVFQNCTVVVTYTGGYSEAPYEVKVALMTLAQAYLVGVNGGLVTLTAGHKEVVAGVGSIDYGASSASQLAIFGTPYAELGPYVSILEKYREPSLA